MSTIVTFFTDQTTNATSNWALMEGTEHAQIVVVGTWDGATVTFECLAADGTSTYALKDSSGIAVTLTANGSVAPILFARYEKVRMVISGGGASLSLTGYAQGLI